MTSLFDKLNLRPNERRLVIIVAIVVFILLNVFFVRPYFGEWGRLQTRQKLANDLLTAFQDEIRKTPQYEAQQSNLRAAGANVASEEQALKLSTTIYNQAALSGVQVNKYDAVRQTAASSMAKTNQFFDEQSAVVNVTGEEKALVDFLYSLGVGGSLIRVRSMSLTPDQPRHRLQGVVTVVASYAKKTPPRVAPTAAPAKATNAPASPRSTNAAGRPNSPFTRTNPPPKTK
jgi:hypothetical protein